MATNGTATDDTAQVSEISIDLLNGVEQNHPSGANGSRGNGQPSEANESRENGQPSTATVSIPHETTQTVQATVESTDGGRWRCDFHVDPCSAAVSQTLEDDPLLQISDVPDWVTPVLNIIEALVTEAGC